MTTGNPEAREAVEPYLLGPTRIGRCTQEAESWPDEDSFGLKGTVSLERVYSAAVSEDDRDAVIGRYRSEGFTELPRDSYREDDVARFRLNRLDPSNPFLWEREVEVGVGGRQLIGSQRELLRRKVQALRAELSAMGERSRRRPKAIEMLKELETGLQTRVSVELRRRVFRPDPVLSEGAVMGEVLPLSRMSQLVYTVVPKDPDERDDEDAEPMYMTLLGVDERRLCFLFSGGIAGRRTIKDLDNGGAYHAWFQNRKAVETTDTAPWVSRRVLRGLVEGGASKVLLRRGREDEPIAVTANGEETMTVRVCGEERDVPVLSAVSAKDDRLWVLKDASNPLVLRLEEAGAELVRTVDEIRRLEGF